MIKQEHNKDKRQKKPLIKFGKRLKKRHLLIEFLFTTTQDEQFFRQVILARNDLSVQIITTCLLNHFTRYWGEHGRTILLQKPALKVIYLNAQTHMCIVQIPHAAQSMFQSCLPLLNRVSGDQDEKSVSVSLRVLHVSGTIRSLKQVAIAYHNKWMREVQMNNANVTKRFEGQDFIAFDDEDELRMGDDDENEKDKNKNGDDDDDENQMRDDVAVVVKPDAKYVDSTLQLITLASSSTSAE